MNKTGRQWVVVLAGGDGKRLQTLTTLRSGVSVPKQFCALDGGPSLLRSTLKRAERLAPRDRIVIVVSAQHREWWEAELGDYPSENVVVQPENKGTAPGILLPLLRVLARDRRATVLLTPSDHFVAHEGHLLATARSALLHAEQSRRKIFLLGVEPEEPDSEYGWIVPNRQASNGSTPVSDFVEKPSRRLARRLMKGGAVWNSFVFAASGQALVALYRRSAPDLLERFVRAGLSSPAHNSEEQTRHLYRQLWSVDFSRDILQRSVDRLCMMTIPSCGWSDVGTPQRIARCLDKLPPRDALQPQAYMAAVDLSQALYQAQ